MLRAALLSPKEKRASGCTGDLTQSRCLDVHVQACPPGTPTCAPGLSQKESECCSEIGGRGAEALALGPWASWCLQPDFSLVDLPTASALSSEAEMSLFQEASCSGVTSKFPLWPFRYPFCPLNSVDLNRC